MGTVYTSNKSRRVIISYVCSHCKSMITMEGQLNAIGRSGNKSHAQMAADKAFADAVYALEHAGEKPFLVRKLYEFEDEVAKNTVNAFQFSMLERSCAYCGHHELWQNPNDKGITYDSIDWSGKLRVNSIKGIPEENRPHFLDSAEALREWRLSVLRGLVENADNHWKENPQEANRLRAQLFDCQKQIGQLQEQSENLNGPCNEIRKEIESKTAEAKNYSFLSGERRMLNKEIHVLEKQLKSLESDSSNQLFAIRKQIADLKNQIKAIVIANSGLAGKLDTLARSESPFYELVRYE